ncbi:NADH dehydrogenase subunit 3, mitochondrion [Sphaceloma murrayae]|uniref:NADH dehydrogenase subunit 3, mitochondrion n=1 Tax=Sphaceloma murrayae TaxID=2082308 RepID=A0A2K1QTY9_9PEZI|nr:NADH dehydrogenase subunit 3, mitochondrion [Sphaceloma murrayae]
MGVFSILPERLVYIEQGISWFFLFLGLVTIGPWLLIFLYDLVLYLWRAFTHDIPLVGGRAKGKSPPRAPSLAKRPNGHRRRFSLAALSVDLTAFTIPEDDEYQKERNDSLVDSGTDNEHMKRRHVYT